MWIDGWSGVTNQFEFIPICLASLVPTSFLFFEDFCNSFWEIFGVALNPRSCVFLSGFGDFIWFPMSTSKPPFWVLLSKHPILRRKNINSLISFDLFDNIYLGHLPHGTVKLCANFHEFWSSFDLVLPFSPKAYRLKSAGTGLAGFVLIPQNRPSQVSQISCVLCCFLIAWLQHLPSLISMVSRSVVTTWFWRGLEEMFGLVFWDIPYHHSSTWREQLEAPIHPPLVWSPILILQEATQKKMDHPS